MVAYMQCYVRLKITLKAFTNLAKSIFSGGQCQSAATFGICSFPSHQQKVKYLHQYRLEQYVSVTFLYGYQYNVKNDTRMEFWLIFSLNYFDTMGIKC